MNAKMLRGAMGAAVLAGLSFATVADILHMPAGQTSLEFVPVTDGAGQVAYAYNIGKFEVTAGQYTEFLNAVAKTDTYGLYSREMANNANFGCNIQRDGASGSYTYSVASDWANRPVNWVSWGDAARFTNWLTNGQKSGSQTAATTEDGAYFLNGATSNAALQAVTRKNVAGYYLPTQDEWFKAAYYNPTTGQSYLYPTSSNTPPGRDLADASGNNANYYVNQSYTIGSPYYRTPVGQFADSASPYGTFDQGGNVFEFSEAIIRFGQYDQGGDRVILGGSCFEFNYVGDITSSVAGDYSASPSAEYYKFGFRVTQDPSIAAPSTAVPLPSAVWAGLILLGGMGLLRLRRKAMA